MPRAPGYYRTTRENGHRKTVRISEEEFLADLNAQLGTEAKIVEHDGYRSIVVSESGPAPSQQEMEEYVTRFERNRDEINRLAESLGLTPFYPFGSVGEKQ